MTEAELATTLRSRIKTLVAAQAGLGLALPNERFEDDGQQFVRHSYQVNDAGVIGVGTAKKLRAKTGRVYLEIFWPKNLGEGDAKELATALEAGYRDQQLHQDLSLGEPHTTPRPDNDWFVLVVSIPFRATMLT